MSRTKIAGTSCAGRALAQLRAWPSIEAHRADCGVGIGVGTRAGQVLHFHDEDHASLRLTQPVIHRLRGALAESGVGAAVDDDWIAMQLHTPTDTTLLLSLVSMAIKANAAIPASQTAGQITPCAPAFARSA